jgi:hypothetical protein
MRFAVGLLPLALLACATPNGVPKGSKNDDNRGPTLDLAGFVMEDSPDLAEPTAVASGGVDLASHADLSSATDMTTAVAAGGADMAMSGGCPGGVTYAGSCSGYTLTYCNTSNKVKTIDCSLAGNVCAVVSGDADCRAPTSGCGSVTSGGLCVGNTLKYCNAGQIVTQNCGVLFTCVDNGSYADCY